MLRTLSVFVYRVAIIAIDSTFVCVARSVVLLFGYYYFSELIISIITFIIMILNNNGPLVPLAHARASLRFWSPSENK